MKKILFCLPYTCLVLSCTEMALSGTDMNVELALQEALSGESSGAEVTVGGETAGEAAGDSAGTLSFAGETAGDVAGDSAGNPFGISPVNGAGDLAGEDTPVAVSVCGELICDENAMCVAGPEGPSCQCEPRYEGDGSSCAPINCPENASGEPNCLCDEGYEGELIFELSSNEWMGSCRFINPCALITIREESFIETSNLMIGATLHEACIVDEPSVERYRFSFEAGEVYSYYGAGGSNSSCSGTANENAQEDHVSVWPYSGGVLTDQGLFRVRDLSYTVGECTYDVLGVANGPVLDLVYLAPTGRICDSGDLRSMSCGEGACRADGVVRCENGEWVERCTPEPGLDGPDTCDGLDSDCDGSIDEDFSAEETHCGVGMCAATGRTSCSQGLLRNSCRPEPSSGADASCDGLDQDCDGSVDEAFVNRLVSCGEGVCRAEGVILCSEGTELSECSPEPPTGDDADCNNIDEDCDGSADEAYVGQAVSCGVGACLYDGFTRCISGVAEEACTPLEPAENDASCDGVDDDCDGRVDEDFEPELTTCGIGACLNSGMTACVDGEEQDLCEANTPLGEDHECDHVDSDCDGRFDEAFESVPMPCSGAGVYECAVTAPLLCINGQSHFDCEAVLSELNDESCDGLDDDCDGRLDENYISIEVRCGLGECADSSMSRCVDGEVTDRCLLRSPTGDDSDCDGRDDDCDGSTDESFVEEIVSCGQGACASTGMARCVDGQYLSECVPHSPSNPDESACDNIDNDCDGRIDEAYASQRNDCGYGVCYAVGSSSCRAGVESLNCEPLPSTGNDADCDGVDQDCDDQADESYPPHIDECGTGVCYNTANSSCVDGEVQNNCVPLPQQGNDSLCDGIDQDCDGQIDEAYVSVPTTCTYGSVCVQDGMTACVNGQVRDVCDPPAFYTGSDNSCNLQDNDCDGRLDEGFVGGVFYCGNGICQGSGFRSCVNGQEGGGQCTPNNNLATSDANCNGSDDDCDGRTDEHYGSYNVNCGRGVCRRSGVESCSGGNLVSTCRAGSPTGPDDTYDGLDNDCDGRTDEAACSFVSSNDGCNGNDDDCDGRVDEDFSSYVGTCGQGVCASTGTVSCNHGNEVSSCSPNNNNSSVDSNCDNVDNDCDGRFDEHYNGGLGPCGVGECKSVGSYVCQGGSPVHACTPGQPSAEVPRNGLDDDCDASIDEGDTPPPSDCGNVTWYISTGRSTLNEFCCVNTTNCESYAVSTSVKQPGNEPSAAQDHIVCKDGSPFPGRGSYHINSGGPYYYNGLGDFTYWQISPTGTVVDSGQWNCGGGGGGGGGGSF